MVCFPLWWESRGGRTVSAIPARAYLSPSPRRVDSKSLDATPVHRLDVIQQELPLPHLHPRRFRREPNRPAGGRDWPHPRQGERVLLCPGDVGEEVHLVARLRNVGGVLRVIGEGIQLRLYGGDELRLPDPIEPCALESEIVVDQTGHAVDIAPVNGLGVLEKHLSGIQGVPPGTDGGAARFAHPRADLV
jgi:hypothetical protein